MLSHITMVILAGAASVLAAVVAGYLLLATGCRRGIEYYYGA